MRFHEHVISSALLAVVLYRRQPACAAVLLAGGVLIDADHYLAYGSQTGDWSLSGVRRFARYRGRIPVAGDTLPRYESLRTRLHQPLLTLPLLWWAARFGQLWRALAIGVSLHLLLDYLAWPWAAAAVARAGGICPYCGRRRQLEAVIERRDGRPQRWAAACRSCRERAAMVY